MKNLDILGKFDSFSKENPNGVMIYDDRPYTYSEIDELSTDLSLKILNKVGHNNRIGICLDHSYKILVAVIAILKSGNSYVPINKKLKEMDRNNIIEISKIKLMILDFNDDFSKNIENINFNSVKRTKRNNNRFRKIKSEDEVYVLFTSGSTGNPKGCSVNYKNLCYILHNMQRICPVSKSSVYLFSTPFSFDVSITEIFSWVYESKILVFDISSYKKFRELDLIANKYKVTHMAASPSYFLSLLTSYSQDSLINLFEYMKFVMIAGEEFKIKIFDLWKKSNWKYRLFNLYGPTEATVYALYHELKKSDNYNDSVPLGKSLNGCKYYVDKKGNQDIGELILMGDGVCDGYINDEKENNLRFNEINNIKTYRTGDYVQLQNNNLLFKGRKDNQIQINGIRVELGEIENRIRKIDIVDDVAIIFYNKVLIANIVLNKETSKEKFNNLLEEQLERHMIPNYYTFVKELKKNLSNKIDKKYIIDSYLTKLNQKNDINNKNSYQKVGMEEYINIIKEQLNIEKLSMENDIFELGANSLDIFNIVSVLEKKCSCNIDIDMFYREKTIKNIYNYMCEYVDSVDTKNIKLVNNESEIYDIMNKLSYKLSVLNTDIFKYLYKKEQCLFKYEAINLQYEYIRNKFNSTVSSVFKLGNKYSLDKVNNSIKGLIEKNPILRSKISIEGEKVFIMEYNLECEIPFIDITGIKAIDLDFVLNYIENSFSDLIYISRYYNAFLALFVIIKNDKELYLYFILDHCISDASNVKVIKEKIVKSLKNSLIDSKYKYKEFCENIRMNNKDINKILSSNYLNDVIKCKPNNFIELISSLRDSMVIKQINNIKSRDSNFISILQSYIIGIDLLEKTDGNCIAIKNILNIRDFDEFVFADTIGDMHSSIIFILKKEDSFLDFKNRAEEVINQFCFEYFRPSYSMYFLKDSKVKKLKKEYKESVFVSSNYIGAIKKEETSEMINKIKINHEKMYNSKKYILVTSFSVDNSIHIICNKEIFSSKHVDFNNFL